MTSLQGHCGIRRRGTPETALSVRGGKPLGATHCDKKRWKCSPSIPPSLCSRSRRTRARQRRNRMLEPRSPQTEQSATGSQKGAATPVRQYSNHVWTDHRRKFLPLY